MGVTALTSAGAADAPVAVWDARSSVSEANRRDVVAGLCGWEFTAANFTAFPRPSVCLPLLYLIISPE